MTEFPMELAGHKILVKLHMIAMLVAKIANDLGVYVDEHAGEVECRTEDDARAVYDLIAEMICRKSVA